ncbi:MAG: methyltransferase [Shimia sp.]
MADTTAGPAPGAPTRLRRQPLAVRLAVSPRFQALAARWPILRRIARREGEALFDTVAGFIQSQCLFALVELGILDRLREAPASEAELAALGLPIERLRILLNAGQAMGLIRPRRGIWQLTPRGASAVAVPGLTEMIRHHDILYRDLSDPVAFFRGTTETELAGFWPYVFGAGAAQDPSVARRYSDLMADSQALVAEDTLRVVDLSAARTVLDVGGGSGAFLTALGQRLANPHLHLFDLPAVVPDAQARFARAGLAERATITPGSFRDDPLPTGADALTLVRVLYDHQDETVAALLRAAHAALPVGGRLVVSEPMTGGARPHVPGDVYFSIYCLAMQTGRARSAAEIAQLMAQAGFSDVTAPKAPRPFITSCVVGVKRD